MPNPLENKMLLYYINALGSGLANKDDPMQAVAGVTQQTIATQSYMNLIKQMLSGGDAKFSTDGKKFKLDGPSALLGDVSELSKEQKVPFAGAPSGTAMNVPGGQLETSQDLLRQMFLNPSASPLDISGADLVGLTPENISQALQLRFMGEELERRRLSDLREMMVPTPVAPIQLPGVGRLSLKQWQSLPTKERSYAYYVFTEKQRGDEPLEYEEWTAETDAPTQKQLYDIGKEDPEFAKWLTKYKEAGAIKIDIAGREVEKGLGKGQARVIAPGYAQEIREGLMKDRTNWPSESLIKQYTNKGLPYIEAEERAQRRMVLETMDKQIRQAFKGKKVTLGEDGWEVDGELKVRYP